MSLLRLQDVTRRDVSGDRVILDSINVTIDPGQRVGLVGPSGSGKSSLLRAIARLDRGATGSLWFRNQLVTHENVPRFRRQVIYLAQRPALFPGTVRENLQLPFRLAVSDRSYEESRVEQLIHELGKPTGVLDQSTESLSGGEQQLIALVRALMLDPVVLLLDEPTASLDPDAAMRLEQLVLKWQGEASPTQEVSRSLVWTSHNVEQIKRVSTCIWRIDQGVLDSRGEP